MLDLLDAPPHRFDDVMRDERDCRPEIRTLGVRHHTARKPHKCDVCARPIAVGTRYTRTVQTVDGAFEITVMHRWGECPR